MTQVLTVHAIQTLVAGFEACTVPLAEWTHRSHVIVAAWYLEHHPVEQATQRMRSGIQRFNAIQGTTGNPEGGYHETITLVWLHLVRWRLGMVTPGEPIEHRVRQVVEALADKNLPFEYYSREHLMSARGRAGWVEPDLKPLPRIPD